MRRISEHIIKHIAIGVSGFVTYSIILWNSVVRDTRQQNRNLQSMSRVVDLGFLLDMEILEGGIGPAQFFFKYYLEKLFII